MLGVLYRVRRIVRRRWIATAAVAVLVALVSGAVLTLVAGARRTASAPDRFTASVGGDSFVALQQESGPPRTAEVARLPGVRSVYAMTFAFADFVIDGSRPTARFPLPGHDRSVHGCSMVAIPTPPVPTSS
jgi:hypothetical protein